MDQNQAQTPTPVTPQAQPIQPVEPVAYQAPQQPTPPTSRGGSRKGIILFLIVLLIVIVSAGAIYTNTSKKTATIPTQAAPVIPEPSTITQISPTQTPEEELGQVDVTTTNTDMQDIQADLQQL